MQEYQLFHLLCFFLLLSDIGPGLARLLLLQHHQNHVVLHLSARQPISQSISQPINQWHRPRSYPPASSSASPAPCCSSPAGQSTNQSVSQSITHAISQPISQLHRPRSCPSISSSASQAPCYSSHRQSINQLVNRSVSQWIRTRSCQVPHHSSLASQPNNQLNQSIYHSTNQ